ncbi:MAG: helix-turn-helix transcriptional regulator [Schwartzia sp.]|nr:helix-turn-helix transcriptional regulator [Schwartzia sp. (in: firmicutes)]
MDARLFVLHISSYFYLVLSYMAAQGAFSWLVPFVPGGRTALNLLYMVFASAGMLAFGFFHRHLETRGRLFALLLANGAARAAMELLPAGAARTAAALLFLLGCGCLVGLVFFLTARRVPRSILGRFVGGSMAAATGLMFLLSLAGDVLPTTALATAVAFGAMARLLGTDGGEFLSPGSHAVTETTGTMRLPLLAGVAALLSFAYGINDSTSYLRFEEFQDAFGLSRLALCAGLLLAGQLADRRRAHLPLAAMLGGAATMVFHAMTLEGFPAWALFYANEFFWSFSFLFILLVFMETSLRTERPQLWAGMGRLIEMPAEGLGAALGTAMMAAFPPSAVLTAYTLVLTAAAGLLYRGLLFDAEAARRIPPCPPMLRAARLCPATEDVAEAEEIAGEEEEKSPPSPEDILASWRERYALTNRETDILREAALSDGTATDIGKVLFIATSTVRFHLSHLLRKTGFSTRKELAEAFLAEMEEHA